jgi:hypothetical protein
MSDWKKVITSGSDAELNSLYAPSITGSLHGTASWAQNSISSSYALTASYSSNLQISGSINNVDYIDFNTGSATPADQEGRIYWDEDNGTLSLGMHGGQVVQQIGLEEYFYVKNQTGTTILNGTVTYASGTLGTSGRILADLMVADGTIPYFFTLGITTEDIVDGDDGYVTQFGLVRGINTTGSNGETWVDGDILYVSPTVPGTLTKFEPEAPNLRLQMAIVIKAATNGSLFVRPNLGSDVGSLHDVLDTTTTASYGDILVKSGSIWTTSKQLTGSYGLTGSLTATSFTGSLQGTSSWAANAVTSSYVLNSVSSSFASTASFVNPLVQDVIITGSLVVSASGTINDFQVGANKLFVSASGNVGIGTTTPQNKLHVLGNADALALEGIDHVYQEYFPQGISAGRFGYTGYSSSGSTDFRIYNEAGDGRILLGTSGSTLDAIMSILGNGNVGVGVTLPSQINARFHINNTSNSASFLVEDSANPDSTPFIINNNGLVGIGTTSPSTSLHIVSPAFAGAENLQRWQISDSDAFIQLQNGTAAAATFIPALISSQPTSSTVTAMSFAAGIGADTGTTPAMIFQARSGSAAAILNRPLFRWSNYTSDLMWLNATGSLSIGVATAATKLHIQGDTGLRVGRTAGGDTQYIDINHNISSAGTPAITSFSPTNNAKTLIINATTDTLSTPASAGNVGIALLTYGTGSLWVDSKQFVGVGIAVPTAKLHVTNTSPSASFLVEDSTNPDATPFVIDNAGNVGIGTQTPTAKLDVSGSLSITGSISLTNILTLQSINPLPLATNGSISFSSSGDFYFASGSAWHKLTL